MRRVAISVILISLVFSMWAQNSAPFKHVPKQYSLELGYRYNFDNPAGYTAGGYSLLFDYAWQLSGFNNGKASYISVPLGYTYFAAQNNNLSMRILSYGWTVRHELSKQKKVIPFLSYGLLLNKINFEDKSGGLMGHKTLLGGGSNIKFGSRKLYIALNYIYTTFYQLEADKIRMQGVELNLGIRF